MGQFCDFFWRLPKNLKKSKIQCYPINDRGATMRPITAGKHVSFELLSLILSPPNVIKLLIFINRTVYGQITRYRFDKQSITQWSKLVYNVAIFF